MIKQTRIATEVDCSQHAEHSPVNLIVEYHHVIPQAWQHFWVPPKAKLDSDGLWDARTVAICPTGHRNVHVLIVRLMKMAASTHDEAVFLSTTVPASRPQGHRAEFDTAVLALERFTAAGGKLLALAEADEWGMS